jgi:phospholipid/cholesterol/gamma-HCH transport system permease protein
MSRAGAAPPAPAEPAPGALLGVLAYLGGLARLAGEALRAARRARRARLGDAASVGAQLDGLIAAGLPLVLLVHLSMGSFLAMQAYFGATFRDAAGAVVGIGLSRNLAPLLTGFLVSGLMAARVVPELRGRSQAGVDPGPPGPLAAARILAAIIAGPVLAFWGAVSGFVSGMLVARSILGVSPGMFLNKFLEMVRPIDAVGVGVKGAGFAAAGALLACFEGLRGGSQDVARSASRAACLSAAAILLLNSLWFSLAYLSGNPFGPGVAWD